MNKRLKEIFARKQEIRQTLTAPDTTVDVDAITRELEGLNTEETEIRHRIEIAEGINVGEVPTSKVSKPTEERTQYVDRNDTMEYRTAFMKFVTRGVAIPRELRVDPTPTNENTMTADLGAPDKLGAVVPTTTLNRIIEKMEATGMILSRVTRTAYRGGLAIPTSNVKPVATWVGEGKTSGKQKKTTGAITFSYYKLRCAVSVSLETDTMALAAFEAALVANVAEAMTKALEQAIISGDGDKKPTGIVTATAPTGQEIDVKNFDYATLQSIEDTIPIEYENGGVYIMTKKSFGKFAGMVDANKQPIARVTYGINNATERSLLGRPVICCNYLPSFDAASAGDVFALVFRLEDYVLNTNYEISMKQYEDNETDDQVRKSIMLVDGKVVDTGSLVKLKKVATA